MRGRKTMALFMCLLTLHDQAQARSMRTIHLADGEMEQIYVEPGFSTLLKFNSHPEPGLIGDQDGFKVEYLKNIVAIKPLVTKGKTNLFVFTKEGQFNFQLIASRGQHDNMVYVEAKSGPGTNGPSPSKTVIAVDDLLKKKINKTAKSGPFTITLDSIAMPLTRSALVLRVLVRENILDKMPGHTIDTKWFSLNQGNNLVRMESIFLESKALQLPQILTTGLILIRTNNFKKNEPLKLNLNIPAHQTGIPGVALQVSFSADFARK